MYHRNYPIVLSSDWAGNVTLAQTRILICMFINWILTTHFAHKDMTLGEVDLPKGRHLVSSGLGSDAESFGSETTIP